MKGYEGANGLALDLWEEVYPEQLLFALTDTFSTWAFFQVSPRDKLCPTNPSRFCFRSPARDISCTGLSLICPLNFSQDFASVPSRVDRWRGLRQDSGDPYEFAPRARDMYDRAGVDFREKTIIYSDSLNLEKVLRLKEQCDEIGFKGMLLRTLSCILADIHVENQPHLASGRS
jgi:nicotinate phosphoribosyltransferase